MPVPGLSLMGFLDEHTACDYLSRLCVNDSSDPSELSRRWKSAKGKLGPAFKDAGRPTIKKIDAAFTPYLEGVKANPRFAETVRGRPFEFCSVEIDPILAFQLQVETNRSAQHCGGLSSPPTLEEMLQVCLPHDVEQIAIDRFVSGNSIAFRYKTGNFRLMNAGIFDGGSAVQFAGVVVGMASPLVHVIRISNRIVLANGYHRAFGLRQAGATHMPCLVIESSDWNDVGALGEGANASRKLLLSSNPPTCGHYTQGRAVDVQLRDVTRVLHVSWSESAFLDEE